MSKTKVELFELNSRPLWSYPVFNKELDKPSAKLLPRGGGPIDLYKFLSFGLALLLAIFLLRGVGLADPLIELGEGIFSLYLALFTFMSACFFKSILSLTDSKPVLGLEEKEILVLSESLEEKEVALKKLKEKRNEALEGAKEFLINL